MENKEGMMNNQKHRHTHRVGFFYHLRQLRAFVRKEFIHIIRDPYTLMILILMPVVEMLLFGFALNMEVTNLRTLVIDQTNDRYSRQIADKIANNKDFILQGIAHNPNEIETLMRANKLDLAIIIPNEFEKHIITGQPAEAQIILDATDPNSAKIAAGYASAIIASVVQDDLAISGEHLPFRIDIQNKMLYNPTMHSSYNFVPGVMGLVLIILCTIMTSVSIAREKERGNMELLLASPANSTIMVLSKAVPYFILSFINIATILLLSYFVLDVPIRGHLIDIILITMIYIFLSLAIGLAISGLVKVQRDAILISGFGMMMPTIILGGMLFPIASMPIVLQWFSTIVPSRYYIDAIRKVMIQGLPLSGVLVEVLVLSGMALVTITVAILNIRPRLK